MKDDLGDAVLVPQVQEFDAAVVADRVDPTGQGGPRADVRAPDGARCNDVFSAYGILQKTKIPEIIFQ